MGTGGETMNRVTSLDQIPEGRKVYLPNLNRRGVVLKVNFFSFDPTRAKSVNIQLEGNREGEYYEANLMELRIEDNQ
jgi:hypothetical protein